jgi:hypothetical protein
MPYESKSTQLSIVFYDGVAPIIPGILACEQEDTKYYHDQFLGFRDCEFNFRNVRSDYDHRILVSNQRQCAWYLRDLRRQRPEAIAIPSGRIVTVHNDEVPIYEAVCQLLQRDFSGVFPTPSPLQKSLGLEQIALEFRPSKKENNCIYFNRAIEIRHIFPISQRPALKQLFETSGLFKTPELFEKTLRFFDS